MKNLLKLFAVLFSAAFLFSACEGPMGPAGANGSDGTDGEDGKDANETCKLCHNSSVLYRQKQLNMSIPCILQVKHLRKVHEVTAHPVIHTRVSSM